MRRMAFRGPPWIVGMGAGIALQAQRREHPEDIGRFGRPPGETLTWTMLPVTQMS